MLSCHLSKERTSIVLATKFGSYFVSSASITLTNMKTAILMWEAALTNSKICGIDIVDEWQAAKEKMKQDRNMESFAILKL